MPQEENVAYTIPSNPARCIGLEKHDTCCKETEASSYISSAFIEKDPQFHTENGEKVKTP